MRGCYTRGSPPGDIAIQGVQRIYTGEKVKRTIQWLMSHLPEYDLARELDGEEEDDPG